MNFNEYQEQARTFRLPSADDMYAALNLGGEAGELLSVIAKARRDGLYTAGERLAFYDKIRKEAGDVLWQLSAVLDDYGIPLEDVAQLNIEKLSSRKQRGVINGSGDNR